MSVRNNRTFIVLHLAITIEIRDILIMAIESGSKNPTFLVYEKVKSRHINMPFVKNST